MDDTAERLDWLRRTANLANVRAAADAYGIHYETYKKVASGERPLARDDCASISRHHGISPGWLMFGEGTPNGKFAVPLQGCISAGQTIVAFERADEQIDGVITVPGTNAFEVRGDSMYPLARDRDVIFVGPERIAPDFRQYVGLECAVTLQDGRRFFKVLERGSSIEHFDLHSYNAEPIRNVEVHSAGRFLGVRRR